MITDTRHLLTEHHALLQTIRAPDNNPPPKKDHRGILFTIGMIFILGVSSIILFPKISNRQASIADPRSRAGQCDPGGQPHAYNECCGPSLSRIIKRTCNSQGQFQWHDETGCNQNDPACAPPPEVKNPPPSCGFGQAYINGNCETIQGCSPQCRGKACGASDGCSGVCTENCPSYEGPGGAAQVSQQGPSSGNGEVINKGNEANPACNNAVCTATSDTKLSQCSCDKLQTIGGRANICDSNCAPVSQNSINCQSEAQRLCKVIQIDVIKNGTVIDAVVCTPDKSKCSPQTIPPPPDKPGGGSPVTETSNPIPTPTPAPQCQRIKVYKSDVVVTDLTTLRAGDQVTIAVVGANATKAHVRVNGAPYEETTTKNAAGEYILSFSIPTAPNSFTIEAEVYQNGTWQ